MTAGFVMLWSGYKNASIKDTLTSFLKGKSPAAHPTGAPEIGISSASGPSPTGQGEVTSSGQVIPIGGTVSGASAKANQAAAMLQAAAFGWVGSQWTALNNVEMAEAGWNNLAMNPSSGAFGIAQALGHGNANTAGKYGNQYGGFGLSDTQAQQANNGAAGPQIQWMLQYIQTVYTNPENAWAHEQANHWY